MIRQAYHQSQGRLNLSMFADLGLKSPLTIRISAICCLYDGDDGKVKHPTKTNK